MALEYTLDTLMQNNLSPLKFTEWMQQEGFLANAMNCENDHGAMKLERSSHFGSDGVVWRCPIQECRKMKSVRRGSYFRRSHWSLYQQMQLIIQFAGDTPAKSAARVSGVSRSSVTDYYDNIRGLYSDDLAADPIEFTDPDEYEADELIIQQVETAPDTFGPVWVASIVERSTGKTILNRVPNRKRETLVPPIVEAVPAGNFVYTDELASYMSLPTHGFHHHHVNHSAKEYYRIDIVDDEEREVHINTAEGVNSLIRARLKAKARRNIERIDIMLVEIMYRKSGRSLFQPVKDEVQ